MVVAASTTVSTSKTFTYTTLLGGVFNNSSLPVQIKKVVISATTSVGGTGNLGAASLFAELVGQPFSAGAGATAEGACASVCETVGVGGKCYLVLKPTLSGNRNWVDPSSTATMISMSAISALGAQIQYAIRVYYTLGRQAGYGVA